MELNFDIFRLKLEVEGEGCKVQILNELVIVKNIKSFTWK